MDNRNLTLLVCGGIMLLMYVIILALILSDLWSGVRKAKQRGEYRTSVGYKKTIEKIAKYYNMTFCMSLVDVAQVTLIFFLWYFYEVDIWMIPWFTIFAMGYVAWVEIHSIWEPADIKEQKEQQDYMNALAAIIKQYGGAEKVIQMITQKGGEEK